MTTSALSQDGEAALMMVADWHWRKGPRWRAALAWAFGKRELLETYKGDAAEIAWFFGQPFLVKLNGETS